MKEQYDQAISLIYNITKEHTEDGIMDGDALAVLENVLEYMQECVTKNIYENL